MVGEACTGDPLVACTRGDDWMYCENGVWTVKAD